MSDLKVACPHCGQHLEVPEDMLGTLIDCPSCHASMQLPTATEVAAQQVPAPAAQPPAGEGPGQPGMSVDDLLAMTADARSRFLSAGVAHNVAAAACKDASRALASVLAANRTDPALSAAVQSGIYAESDARDALNAASSALDVAFQASLQAAQDAGYDAGDLDAYMEAYKNALVAEATALDAAGKAHQQSQPGGGPPNPPASAKKETTWWRRLLGGTAVPAKTSTPAVEDAGVTEVVVHGSSGPVEVRQSDKLPSGRSRCPKCRHEFDWTANTIVPPARKPPQGDDEATAQIFMKMIGEVFESAGQTMPHLRCPKCGTTWIGNAS